MVYLLHKGYADGLRAAETGPSESAQFMLDRNRPDWQEVMIRDWAEMGVLATHFYTWPEHWEDPHIVQAIEDYVSLSEKHGLKMGFWLGDFERFGGPENLGGNLHPDHPDNRMPQYIEWVERVARFGKGRVDQYVVGDELNSSGREEYWTPQTYMSVYRPIVENIKSVDPEAGTSMHALGGLDWDYIEQMMDLGYADCGDGIAVNFRDYPPEVLSDFVKKVRALHPRFELWSNGLHWIGTRDAIYYGNDPSPVWVMADNRGQAVLLAQRTFKLFDAGWDRAPYYIAYRGWELPDGTTAPHWFGFFGFADLVVDEYDNLTIKRHPGWYAYQTISHVFHSRATTKPALFELSLTEPVDYVRAYVRDDYECLLVLWNDPAVKMNPQESRDGEPTRPGEGVPDLDRPGKLTVTTLTLPTRRYTYPVSISLFNYRNLTDLPYQLNDDELTVPDVHVGQEPVIIRLVAESQEYHE